MSASSSDARARDVRAAPTGVGRALLVAVAAVAACGPGTTGPVLSVPTTGQTKLIYTPSNEPTGVTGLTYLRDHVQDFERGPFDGLAVDVGLGDTPWGDVTYTRAQFDAEVDLLRSIPFGKLTDNFQMFNVRTGDVDWFDDAAFAVVLANARTAAEVVRDAGLKGLFFDAEQYDGPVWSYPVSTSTASFAEYEQQAHRRGVQFMSAILEVAPDITILSTLSFSEVFRSVCLRDIPFAEERYHLLPAFLDGMLEARATARAPALIVDGFLSSYGARDPRSFPVFADLIRGDWDGVQARWYPGITSYRFGVGSVTWDATPSIKCSDEVRQKLTRDMPSGMGVMLDVDTVLNGTFHRNPADFDMNFFTPETLTSTLSAALGSAERYVFLWSATMDWLGVSSQPAPPSEYVQAVADARR